MVRGLGSRGGGGFAEGDAFEVSGDKASWNDGQVCNEEKDYAAGGGRLEGDIEETVQGGGEDCDLGEPTEDGELDE